MESKQKTRGSWGIRFFIILLSVIFGILFYWLLGFITQDIGTMEGPDYQVIRQKYVDAAADNQRDTLQKELKDLERKLKILHEQQALLRDSTTSMQKTMDQLLLLQRESLQKNVEFSGQSKQTLQDSQAAFLENQKKYEQYNQQIAELMQVQRQKEDELAVVQERIREQEKQAQKEMDRLYEQHRLKVAAIKLGFLLPVFLAVFWLFMKYRTGTYWPMVWAAFLAAFIKIALIIHEYFPTRYFKYIALLVMLGIVIRILFYLIRTIISPKRELLIRQYQQDYDKHICPICSKPIRIGPLRYLGGWKKKGMVLVGQDKEVLEPQVYTCPSCGTNLFCKCDKCGGVRHTLLPYCEHCGNEKPAKES